ncbi:MAG: pilus assembly protein N-terminal domain-containing protein [Deltaproteobacteria bacterium]|nr:pilus assembly protein N-terminal domain-containing protein [Deltaproteobacteria bacterium]
MKEGLTAKKLSISVSLLLIIFPANSGAEDTARVPEANSLSNFTREIAPGLTGVTIIEDHAGREETIFLLEGQAKTIDAPDTSKVIVSNPEAVKVATAGKKKLLITAMKAGSSDVTMVLKSGRLIIYSVKVGKEAAFTLDTMNADLKRLFPGSNVSVWAEDETLFIEGRVGSNSDLDGILIYLKGYSNKIVNSTRLADFKQVKLEVKIVEVNRTKLRSFGFNIFGAGNSASVGAFAPGSLKGFTFGAAPIELSVSS